MPKRDKYSLRSFVHCKCVMSITIDIRFTLDESFSSNCHSTSVLSTFIDLFWLVRSFVRRYPFTFVGASGSLDRFSSSGSSSTSIFFASLFVRCHYWFRSLHSPPLYSHSVFSNAKYASFSYKVNNVQHDEKRAMNLRGARVCITCITTACVFFGCFQ